MQDFVIGVKMFHDFADAAKQIAVSEESYKQTEVTGGPWRLLHF